MRREEKCGLVFEAEDRVPATFMGDLIEGLYDSDIKEILKDGVTKYNVTEQWEMFLDNNKEEMEEMLKWEGVDVIKELDKMWRGLVKKYLGQEKDA